MGSLEGEKKQHVYSVIHQSGTSKDQKPTGCFGEGGTRLVRLTESSAACFSLFTSVLEEEAAASALSDNGFDSMPFLCEKNQICYLPQLGRR